MAERWMSEDDFEDFFWSMAEAPPADRPKPISENLKKARASFKSIYVEPELPEEGEAEDVEYCLPSRGRHLRGNLRRPGKRLTDAEFKKQIQQQIRQVRRRCNRIVCIKEARKTKRLFQVAGLGYSNELIEHAFGSREGNEDTKDKLLIAESSRCSSTLTANGTYPYKEDESVKCKRFTADTEFPMFRKRNGK